MARRWTTTEEEYIQRELAAGSSCWAMAIVLDRKFGAVRDRIRRIRQREVGMQMIRMGGSHEFERRFSGRLA